MEFTDFLERNPCVRIAIPFIIGIIIGNYLPIPIYVSLVIFGIAITIAILLYNKNLKYTNRWLPGCFVCVSFLALGMLFIHIQQNNYTKNISNINVDVYRAQILTPPISKGKYYKTDLQLDAANIFGKWYNIDTKISATIENDSIIENLKAGQTIEFTAQIDSLSAPKNPFGFDYAKYLQNNGIHGSIFLRSGKWKIADEKVKGISQRALNMRQRLIALLEQSGLSGNELGLASTLVLGYKNNIDAEVKQAYMNAGAMHVLAVSGMHVGIVYFVLDMLMKLFGGAFLYRWKQLLIIFLLWGYAFLTGLSPSVMRATIMFSIVIIGKVLSQDTSVYNSLGCAVLCLLLYDSQMLFKAGFQLSCIAVVGIVFFQPKIANLIKVKNKLGNWLWQLTSVSIAAQIATLPFCLYYFERTPVYFWLSNIVVSPGATILIILTLILLITSPINFLSTFFGFLTKWVTKTMNFLVVSISNLPCSTIENAHITVIQAIAIAIVVILVTSWILTKKYRNLLIAVSVLTLFIFIPKCFTQIKNRNRQAFCIYHNISTSAMQFISGNNSFWLNSKLEYKQMPTFIKDANQYWNVLKNNIITQKNTDIVSYDNGIFAFDTICGFIVNDSTSAFTVSDSLRLDYLVISGNPRIKARQMPKNLKFNNVIIEATVKPWVASDWERHYSDTHIHNIRKDGAYICEW